MNLSGPFSPLKRQAGCLLILVFLSLVVYSNSLKGSFQFDDQNLVDAKWVLSLDAFNQQVQIRQFENRPILLWTFALNNTLHKGQVFGFHLLNLLLHVLVVVLIFFILQKTQTIRCRSVAGETRLVFPFLAALLFAVHPLNTDSVSYIASRSTLLATFFYLLTLYIFLQMFSLAEGRGKILARWVLGSLVAAGLFAGLASKLIAVTLPALLLLWFCFFICPVQFPRLAALAFSKKMRPAYAGIFILLAALALWRGSQLLYSPKDQGLELFGRMPYFWVQAKVIVFHYLNLFFAPINLSVDSGFPFSGFFADPQIPLSILLIAAILIFSLKFGNLWIKAGVLWFFLTLAPTSSLVPLNDLAVEHRMYLPMSLGLCLIAGYGSSRLPKVWRSGVFTILIILLGALTLDRNRVWTDELHLWQDAVRKNPHSPRTHNNLGKAYYEQGFLDQALVHFQKSNENIPRHIAVQYNLKDPAAFLVRKTGNANNSEMVDPQKNLKIYADLAEPHYNLASVYLDKGDLQLAKQEYQTALSLNPNYFSALLGIGSVYTRLGQNEKAIESLHLAIDKRKAATGEADYSLARLNLGEIYGRAGQFAKAVRELKIAVHHDPSLVLGHYNLGVAYLMTGKLEQAEQTLQRCLTLNDRFEPALFNLARVYQAKKEWEKSNLQFERFLKVKGPDAGAFYQIGWNHVQAGSFEEARRHLKQALRSNPPPKQAEEISRLLQELS